MPTTASRPFRAPSADETRNGRRASGGPGLDPPHHKARLPELAIGIGAMIVFALGAVLWHLHAVDKVPALAVSSEIERGQVIGSGDLAVVYVANDDPVVHMSGGQRSQLVGKVALVDLPAGTLLTGNLVSDADELSSADGIAGLLLEPGQYPALGLAPGDRVTAVRTTGGEEPGTSSAVVARRVTISAVEDLDSNRKLVSLRASADDAEAIAAAAGDDSLRLVQVGP